MKISIVTATFNSALTIKDTLECIQLQDYPFVEHIIIDGNSIDDTLKIVSEFSHIAKVISEKDKGIYDAMNKGIGAATGDIIGILNSDDIYISNVILSKIANVFEDKSIDVIYADLQYVKHNNFNRVI